MSDSALSSTEPQETDDAVEQLLTGLQQAAQEITPEFVRTMPRAHFDDTTQAMRLVYIKAIMAAEALGGVRIVRPHGYAQYALEAERHYNEAYALAYAQQHKNKISPKAAQRAWCWLHPGHPR
jgi:hypothetical protein